MEFSTNPYSIILLTLGIISQCYEDLKFNKAHLDSLLTSCRNQDSTSSFECLRSALRIQKETHHSDGKSYKNHNYYTWILSLPTLSPNSTIYNEAPLEVDQSCLYVDGLLKEPKFASIFYKVPFNSYFEHLGPRIKSNLFNPPTNSNLHSLKNKLENILGLPKVVFEAKASQTSSLDDNFKLHLFGDTSKSDEHSRLLLLFVDFYFLRPLKRKAYLLRLLNNSCFTYKLCFRFYSKRFSKSFRRCHHLIADSNALSELLNLSKFFNTGTHRLLPFVPLPTHMYNDAEIALEHSTSNRDFYLLVKNLLSHSRSDTGAVFDLLEDYCTKLYRMKDIRTMGSMDSFYILEVTPKSKVFSYYNMFPQAQRKQIIDYRETILVASHVSKLDLSHFLTQIIGKFLITTPIAGVFTAAVLLYITRFLK